MHSAVSLPQMLLFLFFMRSQERSETWVRFKPMAEPGVIKLRIWRCDLALRPLYEYLNDLASYFWQGWNVSYIP